MGRHRKPRRGSDVYPGRGHRGSCRRKLNGPELLERRTLLSVSANVLTGGVLSIAGDNANDRIEVRFRASDTSVIEVDDLNTAAVADFSFPTVGLTTIRIDAGAGDDEVYVSDQHGVVSQSFVLDIDGGTF